MDRVNLVVPGEIAAEPLAAEHLPDLIQELIKLAQADGGVHDISVIELMEALEIAWLAAERLRIERQDAAMARHIKH